MVKKNELLPTRLSIVIAEFKDESKYKLIDNIISNFRGNKVSHNVFELYMSTFELESVLPLLKNLITCEEEDVVLYHYINENDNATLEKIFLN